MIYTVGWLPSAEAELTRLYNEAAADKRAVSDSCNRIDRDLRVKAERLGVVHDYGRVYSDPPLCVHYKIDPGDLKVTVLQVARL
jgi:hypothetical protein